MTTEQIIEDITSRDTHKVWRSSCEIITMGQDRNLIRPLIQYLPEIIEKTKGLKMGGALAPNQRFIDYTIRIMEFHRDRSECLCNLYIGQEFINPNNEVEKGNIQILDLQRIDGKWVDFYHAVCNRCGQEFRIIERDYHYTWWGWTKITD